MRSPLNSRLSNLERLGECLDDPSLKVMTFDVRVTDGRVEAFLPPTSKLDAILATGG